MSLKQELHQKIMEKMDPLCDWYEEQSKGLFFPFSSSYDIRDSSFKITNVDANIFPAGFNNICSADKEVAPDLIKSYVEAHYPSTKKILLVTEDHMKNSYYWENVFTLMELIKECGYEVKAGMPGLESAEPVTLESYLGNQVEVFPVSNEGGKLLSLGYEPDLVISNNDFSKIYESWTDLSSTPMTPNLELGWYKRHKSDYFGHFNQTLEEFSKVLGVDPWYFQIETNVFDHFDPSDESSQQELAQLVETTLDSMRASYKEHNVDQEPYVFIKNNTGTYGMGIVTAKSGEDVMSWSYKSRKKMKAQKGGGRFAQVIVQEGVPTDVRSEGLSAEPTIYMVGENLVGGFLRAHKEKGVNDNLNSPGAVYKRLCLSDLNLKPEGCPMENVYGWVAKAGLLSIARETKARELTYFNYK